MILHSSPYIRIFMILAIKISFPSRISLYNLWSENRIYRVSFSGKIGQDNWSFLCSPILQRNGNEHTPVFHSRIFQLFHGTFFSEFLGQSSFVIYLRHSYIKLKTAITKRKFKRNSCLNLTSSSGDNLQISNFTLNCDTIIAYLKSNDHWMLWQVDIKSFFILTKLLWYM